MARTSTTTPGRRISSTRTPSSKAAKRTPDRPSGASLRLAHVQDFWTNARVSDPGFFVPKGTFRHPISCAHYMARRLDAGDALWHFRFGIPVRLPGDPTEGTFGHEYPVETRS